jgi:hypothetical protein
MRELQRYLKHGHRVEGWLDGYSATFITELSRIQREAGIAGGVGEIGVHMGRLFILLKLTTAPGERTFAIDVFEDQHLNVDGSGSGDRVRFLDNVAKWTGNASVEIIHRSSLAVRPDDILGLVGPCRLVSIDGGHTEQCVDNDLRLVESVLLPMGVVLLDDVYNQSWPAVAAGAARYFFDPLTTLRPFAITPNKLYLANPAAHAFYRGAVRTSQGRRRDKTVEAFGCVIDLFGCGVHQQPPFRARLKHAVKSRAQRLMSRGRRLLTVPGGPPPPGQGTGR